MGAVEPIDDSFQTLKATAQSKYGMAKQSSLVAFFALARPFTLQAKAGAVCTGRLFPAAADLLHPALVTNYVVLPAYFLGHLADVSRLGATKGRRPGSSSEDTRTRCRLTRTV